MTDGAALLAAIIAQPDEDGPRMQYADCIEEDDSRRAEFIRVQCEIARVIDESLPCVCRSTEDRFHCPACLQWDEHVDLTTRQSELWGHGFGGVEMPAWASRLALYPLSRTGPTGEVTATVRRGFIDRITCPAADWLQRADAILAAHPVQEVTLTTMPRVVATVPDSFDAATDAVVFSLNGRKAAYPVPAASQQQYNPDGILRRGVVLELLKMEWPRVKTWNLAGDAEDAIRQAAQTFVGLPLPRR